MVQMDPTKDVLPSQRRRGRVASRSIGKTGMILMLLFMLKDPSGGSYGLACAGRTFGVSRGSFFQIYFTMSPAASPLRLKYCVPPLFRGLTPDFARRQEVPSTASPELSSLSTARRKNLGDLRIPSNNHLYTMDTTVSTHTL